MNRVRVRQHVNPLAKKYQIPVTPPRWEEIYQHPEQMLLLDIGCARGRFLLEMAQLQPQKNFLGVEIREPLIEAANRHRDHLGLTNLHYCFANINNSLAPLLASLPTNTLQQVTIQFPDPWFKQRHHKRRVVQPELVATLSQYLGTDGSVFLQSDVKNLAEQMCTIFQAHPRFQRQHQQPWLDVNPLPVATEREFATLAKGEPVYRALFVQSALLK